MQQGGDRFDDLGLERGQIGEAEGVERIAEQISAVDCDNEFFDVRAPRRVRKPEEPAPVEVRIRSLALSHPGEDVIEWEATFSHGRTLDRPFLSIARGRGRLHVGANALAPLG
jgi:hypothetical protein